KCLKYIREYNLQFLQTILCEYLDVNDCYVVERLLAVSYGCAMRSRENDKIAVLAKMVYDRLFRNGSPPPHILLRDYARGVIEVALHRELGLEIDEKNIRPPYKSTWTPPSSTADE